MISDIDEVPQPKLVPGPVPQMEPEEDPEKDPREEPEEEEEEVIVPEAEGTVLLSRAMEIMRDLAEKS